MQEFETLIKRFADNGVEFVIIGGVAVTLHGASLVTEDFDVCTPFTEKNMERLLTALEGCHPRHRIVGEPRWLKESPAQLARFRNLYLVTDVGHIDLLSEVSPIGKYEETLKNTIEVKIFDRFCKVLDLDALIRIKKEMKDAKDKETVIQLEAIRERLKEQR